MERRAFDINILNKIQCDELKGYVVAYDNKPVRIINTIPLKDNKYNIVGIVDNGESENVVCFTSDGKDSCGNTALHIVVEGVVERCKFKPFDRVVVRMGEGDQWYACLFSHIDLSNKCYHYATVGGITYGECLPYNEYTEKLIGTDKDV